MVGSVAGIALILGALFFLWRKRQHVRSIGNVNPTFDKPQLHSDSIPWPLHEIGTRDIHELTGDYPHPAEKAANETPAAELPAWGGPMPAADTLRD